MNIQNINGIAYMVERVGSRPDGTPFFSLNAIGRSGRPLKATKLGTVDANGVWTIRGWMR